MEKPAPHDPEHGKPMSAAQAEAECYLKVWGFSAEQIRVLTLAAEVKGQSLTDFIVASAMVTAEMLLMDRRDFKISPEAYDEFLKLLDRPAKEIPQLRDLFTRGKKRYFTVVTDPEADNQALQNLAEAYAHREDEPESLG